MKHVHIGPTENRFKSQEMIHSPLSSVIYSINNTESKRFNQRDLVAMSACMNASGNKVERNLVLDI